MSNHLPKLLIFSLLFLFISETFAQSNEIFKQGFIINNNQDTIPGLLNAELKSLYKTCAFKRDKSDHVIDYSPSDIKAFSFNDGKFYISKELTIKNTKKLVFIEFLIKGMVNIYYLHDEAGNHYYIEKDNNKLVELTEPIEKINIDGSTYEKPKRFKNKLIYLLSDCKDIVPEINKTNLSHSSLIRLGKEYHYRTCTTEDCIVFERKGRPVQIDFSVYGGYYMNKIKFGEQLTSNTGSGFMAGCRFEVLNLLNWTDRLSYAIDVNVTKFSTYTLTEKKYDRVTYKGKDIFLDEYYAPHSLNVDLDILAVSMPISIKHSFLRGPIRPYITLGFNNTLVLNYNEEFVLHRFVIEHNKSVPNYHLGVLGSVGLKSNIGKKHQLFTELTYEYNQSSNVSPAMRFINNVCSLKAGFIF